jgi:hypothetical protein
MYNHGAGNFLHRNSGAHLNIYLSVFSPLSFQKKRQKWTSTAAVVGREHHSLVIGWS